MLRYTLAYTLAIVCVLFAWILFVRGGEPRVRVALALAQAREKTDLEKLWPEGVPIPKGMRLYRKTKYNQHLSITNDRDTLLIYHRDQDDNYTNAPPALNPNRFFPIAVSGGLHESSGWTSRAAIALPGTIYYWTDRIEAGAQRPLPRVAWVFPVGTVTADILSNEGEVFEVRIAEKKPGGWRLRTLWKDESKFPAKYTGARKACSACHDDAGGWKQYGSLWRGSDGVFSFYPFEEGTFTPRTDFTVKHWNE